MGEVEKVARLKKKADAKKNEAAKAAGVAERLRTQLKEDFGVTIEDAQGLLRSLLADHKKVRTKYDTALTKFEEEWSDFLT